MGCVDADCDQAETEQVLKRRSLATKFFEERTSDADFEVVTMAPPGP